MSEKILSIIIPIYNEDKIVADSLPPIFSLPIEKEIIVVNDGSTDATGEVLESLKEKYSFRLISHATNKGKGAAIRRGFREASGDYVIIYDADAEYQPEDVANLFSEIKKQPGERTAVYGSRFLNDRRFSFHTLINRSLTGLTNLLFGSRLTDMETCLKIIPRNFLNELQLNANRFEIEPEITAQIIKRGGRILEFPIGYKYRGYSAGKKIRPKDGWQAVKTLLAEKLLRKG